MSQTEDGKVVLRVPFIGHEFTVSAGLWGYSLGFAAVAFWSVNVLVARVYTGTTGPGHMGAAEINMWRWLVALVVLLPFAIKPMREAWTLIMQRPVFYALLLGGLGIFRISLLNSLIYIAGETASAINMALMGTVGPLFLAILGFFILKRPITLRHAFGYAVTICGVLVLIIKGDISNLRSFHFVVGDAWMLLSAVCFAVYSIILSFKPPQLSSTALLAYSAIIGLAFIMPFGLEDMAARDYSLPPFSTMMVMVYLGLFPSLIAFFCWSTAMELLGPTKAGLIYYMLPLLSTAEAVVFLGESFALSQGFGGALILIGVMFAARQTKAPQQEHGEPHHHEHSHKHGHGVHSL